MIAIVGEVRGSTRRCSQSSEWSRGAAQEKWSGRRSAVGIQAAVVGAGHGARSGQNEKLC